MKHEHVLPAFVGLSLYGKVMLLTHADANL
jgi:hypothetical protein